jgi:YD repeat-containing protein
MFKHFTKPESVIFPLKHLNDKKIKIILSIATALLYSATASAEIVWDANGSGFFIHLDNFPTNDLAMQHCQSFTVSLGYSADRCVLSGQPVIGGPEIVIASSGWLFEEQPPAPGTHAHFAEYYVNKCPLPSVFNQSTGNCGNEEQKGSPPAYSCAGNPINIAIGNKFQVENDFKSASDSNLTFTRYYNSLDGAWRHNYSTFIRFAVGKLSLVRADGRETFFTVDGNTVTPDPTETGILSTSANTSTYTSDTNEQFIFDSTGRLITQIDAVGRTQQLTYVNGTVTVTSDTGQTLSYTEDASHQPLSLTAGPLQIAYTYNTNQRLTQLTRTQAGTSQQRLFFYEDSRNVNLLTGITDERGVRFATWAYDAQGRAISSEHAGGAQRTLVAYNADGSSTVTNELGKNATYRFTNLGGVKRVTAIEGEPSPNCSASNSSYTYNTAGQVLTKTDAQGLITTYSYNDRSLEVSRTEATGTPLARTTTTEWDPSRFLKTKVVEPTRITLYTYDTQGRPLSQQTTAN